MLLVFRFARHATHAAHAVTLNVGPQSCRPLNNLNFGANRGYQRAEKKEQGKHQPPTMQAIKKVKTTGGYKASHPAYPIKNRSCCAPG